MMGSRTSLVETSAVEVFHAGNNQEQRECQKIFGLLRADPKGLTNAGTRKYLMAKIAVLKNKLNDRRLELQKALNSRLSTNQDPVVSWVGPKLSFGQLDLFSMAMQSLDGNMRNNFDLLNRAGFSARKIYEDGNSLFRALAFGLLEHGVDMSRSFSTVDFQKLSSRTQRIVRDSFERLQKNPTVAQLEMELNIREISNAWVALLRQLAMHQGMELIKDRHHIATLVEELELVRTGHPEEIAKSLCKYINDIGNMDGASYGTGLEMAAVAKAFSVPIQIVNTAKRLPELRGDAILLLKTVHHVDLLYPKATR